MFIGSFLPIIFFLLNQGGVPRVHLLDGTTGGALLLELFQRDGIGTMVARYAVSLFGCFFNLYIILVSQFAVSDIWFTPRYVQNMFFFPNQQHEQNLYSFFC